MFFTDPTYDSLFFHRYRDFFKTYCKLKQKNIIKDYLNEGGEKVVFTTQNPLQLIKLGKVPQQTINQEISEQHFLKQTSFLFAIPKSKIVDNYIITTKAEKLPEHCNNLDIFYKENFDKHDEIQYWWNNSFLNCIDDNHEDNFGIINNKLCIIDYDCLRKDFIVKNIKRIKKDWKKLNYLIANMKSGRKKGK